MRIGLITSCTNRKRQPAPPQLRARNLGPGSIHVVATDWANRVRGEQSRTRARDLYGGRSFSEAKAASTIAGAALYIVSAGLGLVEADDLIPSYSLTVTGADPDNVLARLVGSVSPKSWWSALCAALQTTRPLTQLVSTKTDHLFILALPRSYFDLIAEEIQALPQEALRRLRIIGLSSIKAHIAPNVSSSVVVYDERLEVAGGSLSGTRSDFVQRAARHFLTTVLPDARVASAQEHNRLVAAQLSPFKAPVRPIRSRLSDDALRAVIREFWDDTGGRVTAGLRLMRRDRQLACEQSRFKRLFWEVAAEKGLRNG